MSDNHLITSAAVKIHKDSLNSLTIDFMISTEVAFKSRNLGATLFVLRSFMDQQKNSEQATHGPYVANLTCLTDTINCVQTELSCCFIAVSIITGAVQKTLIPPGSDMYIHLFVLCSHT